MPPLWTVVEMDDLKDASARVGFPVPDVGAGRDLPAGDAGHQALPKVPIGWALAGQGETKGEIVGYNCINGTNYGGMDEPLPQGARAAFLIAESEWQEVPSSKGKRGRGST